MRRDERYDGWKLAGAIGGLAAFALAGTLAFREELPPDEIGPPAAVGMPLDLGAGDGHARWLLLTEREGRRYRWGHANGMRLGRPVSEAFRDVELWAFDERLGLRWQRRLPSGDGSMRLEPDQLAGVAPGGAVVIFMGGAQAVSAHDGSALPAVPATFARAPWSTFDTRRLQRRGFARDRTWIGVLTDAEATKLASAEGRAQGWDPDAFGAPGADDDYGVWLAELDAAARIDAGTLRRVAGGESFADAGLVADPAGAVLGGDGAVYVLSRPEGGGSELAAVALEDGTLAWRAALPQRELAMASAGATVLLFYGHAAPPGTDTSTLGRHGVLTAVRRSDGVRRDRVVAALAAD